ncbi:MAG: hypothetical protein RL094_502 [Candidatus Parcubacteria bacterium]|jgi:phosphoenolpyruvate synthase/pyruvate phosphate dikinase
MKFIKTFSQLNKHDAAVAGGKGASLGEMTQAGIPVPPGFVILASTFDHVIESTDIADSIEEILKSVDSTNTASIDDASNKIQKLIVATPVPADIQTEILQAFDTLGASYVAVRSSATAEDGADHAWAGQLESYLNTTVNNLIDHVQLCWASLFTSRAIFYRIEKGLSATKISVAVVIQKMIDSEYSGIAFSVHPVTENRNELIIEAGFGLGEAIVSGAITPDSYVVQKEPRRIIDTFVASQAKGLYRSESGGNEWKNIDEKGKTQVLSEALILELAQIIINIEQHYGFPCDIEWAFEKEMLYIVQSRPITTLSDKATPSEKVLTKLPDTKTPDEWIKDRFFNAFLIEESLVLLLRNKFFLQELGTTYKNTITVKGVGDFLLKSEEDAMVAARSKRLAPAFDFITKVNNLEEKIHSEVAREDLRTPSDYYHIFELMSEHLAYYGLAKDEANLIFTNNNSSKKDKDYIEKWRNNKERWDSHDKLWEKVAQQTNTPIETIHVMLIDEVMKLISGEKIDLLEINKRRNTTWSLVEKDGVVCIHLGDKSPSINTDTSIKVLEGDIAFFANDIVRGIAGEDILVVKKTHPGMIDEIKKAKAIITDEGGILSHAAITAREFKIPCIIGTKIGTEIIKVGDRVEIKTIDAKKGSITILS